MNEFGEPIGGPEPLADDAADKETTVLIAALKRQDARAFESAVREFSPKPLAVAPRPTGNHEHAGARKRLMGAMFLKYCPGHLTRRVRTFRSGLPQG